MFPIRMNSSPFFVFSLRLPIRSMLDTQLTPLVRDHCLSIRTLTTTNPSYSSSAGGGGEGEKKVQAAIPVPVQQRSYAIDRLDVQSYPADTTYRLSISDATLLKYRRIFEAHGHQPFKERLHWSEIGVHNPQGDPTATHRKGFHMNDAEFAAFFRDSPPSLLRVGHTQLVGIPPPLLNLVDGNHHPAAEISEKAIQSIRLWELWAGNHLVIYTHGAFHPTAELFGKCAELRIHGGWLDWVGPPLGSAESGTATCPLVEIERCRSGITMEHVVDYLFSGVSGGKGEKRELGIHQMTFQPEHAGEKNSPMRLKKMIEERINSPSFDPQLCKFSMRLSVRYSPNPYPFGDLPQVGEFKLGHGCTFTLWSEGLDFDAICVTRGSKVFDTTFWRFEQAKFLIDYE